MEVPPIGKALARSVARALASKALESRDERNTGVIGQSFLSAKVTYELNGKMNLRVMCNTEHGSSTLLRVGLSCSCCLRTLKNLLPRWQESHLMQRVEWLCEMGLGAKWQGKAKVALPVWSSWT